MCGSPLSNPARCFYELGSADWRGCTWSRSSTQVLRGFREAVMEWSSWIVVHSCCRLAGLNRNCRERTCTLRTARSGAGHADTDGYLSYLKPPSPSNCTSVPQRIFTTSPRRIVSTRSSPWRKESRPRRQKSSSP